MLFLPAVWVMGSYTVGRDVDPLITYDDTKREDAYAIIKRVIDVPRLEPHIYSLPEYKEMKETIEKMKKDGFVLLDKWNRKRNESLAKGGHHWVNLNGQRTC